MSAQQYIFDAISNERERQDAKWGADRHLNSREWLPILVEEIGEVAKAILEGKEIELRSELVHVAAVVVAWLECIFDNN